jgi:hypothetical protein
VQIGEDVLYGAIFASIQAIREKYEAIEYTHQYLEKEIPQTPEKKSRKKRNFEFPSVCKGY